MAFVDQLQKLKDLNLPEGEFAVVSSGAMAVRGIREAGDLDVLVTEKLWNELARKYPVKSNGLESIELGEIELLGKGSYYHDDTIATVEEIIQTAEVIDGVRFMNLELLKKFKLKMRREKDLRDVALIEEYQNAK